MWNLPGSGVEPVSPMLAVRFFNHWATREAQNVFFYISMSSSHILLFYFLRFFSPVFGIYYSKTGRRLDGEKWIKEQKPVCDKAEAGVRHQKHIWRAPGLWPRECEGFIGMLAGKRGVPLPGQLCCSVTKLCPTLCDPMVCSPPGFLVLYYFLGLAQIHVHWVNDAIQPSCPLSALSPALSLSQHQGLFQWVSASH